MTMAEQAEQYKINEQFDASTYPDVNDDERVAGSAVMAAVLMSQEQRLVFLGLVTATDRLSTSDWLFDFDDAGTVYLKSREGDDEFIVNYFGTPARRGNERETERLEKQVQTALAAEAEADQPKQEVEPASADAILRARE
jgi:hypothetical protein